jgi:1-pyrroline-5-carboxylate dehydrogenase
MANAFFKVPAAVNEPVKSYAPGSPETISLKQTLADFKSVELDIPMIIGGKEVFTNEKASIHAPHELSHKLGEYSKGSAEHVHQAIDAALAAKPKWEAMPWEDRAAIFLRCADLLEGPYRDLLNASTMLAQSKNCFQAEIDAACELIDFFKFNVQYMTELYADQPVSSPGIWNRMEYRALEGFVLTVTPFNFTSICANLGASAAMMGNTIVWKCARTQVYSAHFVMKLFKDAGLPDGVINLVFTDGPTTSDICFAHPEFAGVHFTGSTGVFQGMWKAIGANIHNYKSYSRIVGETGGKDFLIAHESSNPLQVATAMTRGSFEYQGQKCSALSRAYVPSKMWNEVKAHIKADVESFKMGTVDDFGNYINAVIDERAFDKLAGFIDRAKADGQEILVGGNYDKSKGYFIEPTVIVANDPKYVTMCEELFGPILTVFVYDESKWTETLHILDESSVYALTGSVFSNDRYALAEANEILKHTAGNFYINDKPTGAVVGQQPFGGARASGTNDKAGSKHNLMRWVSMRTIKETLNPAKDYRYPFLGE